MVFSLGYEGGLACRGILRHCFLETDREVWPVHGVVVNTDGFLMGASGMGKLLSESHMGVIFRVLFYNDQTGT